MKEAFNNITDGWIHAEITIPSTRIYLRELPQEDADSLLQTMERYSVMYEWAYNSLYDATYNDKPFLSTVARDENGNFRTMDGFTEAAKLHYKELYGDKDMPKDYYYTSLYSKASGALSSQKELLKQYEQENQIRIQNCYNKVESLETELTHKQAIKDAIKEVMTAAHYGDPYKVVKLDSPVCTVTAKTVVHLVPKKGYVEEPVLEYELKIEKRLRRIKHSIKEIKAKIKRLEAKEFVKPKRVTFGGAKFYKSKDTLHLQGEKLEAWKKERHEKRADFMLLSGRAVATGCNYQCLYNYITHEIDLELMDRKILHLKDVRFPYRGDELPGVMSRIRSHRYLQPVPVGFQIQFKTDARGERYFIVKATFMAENIAQAEDARGSVVAIDINYDNIALSELDMNGCLLYQTVFPFNLEKGNSGQNTAELGRVCKQIIDYCARVYKPLAKEGLDLVRKKASLQYGDPVKNRHISIVAYSTINRLLHGQALQQGVEIIEIDPSYTSLIGKAKYMRIFGCSIHEAASYVIGRRAMGFTERVPEYLGQVAIKKKDTDKTNFWRKIYKHLKNIRQEYFYQNIQKYKTWKAFDAAAAEYKYV